MGREDFSIVLKCVPVTEAKHDVLLKPSNRESVP